MYLISSENEYPRFIGDLQLEHPDWQEGMPLPSGWREVADIDLPTIPEGHTLEEGFPTEIDGVLSRNWIVRPLTADEMARINAPATAREKLMALGLTEYEISALSRGIVR